VKTVKLLSLLFVTTFYFKSSGSEITKPNSLFHLDHQWTDQNGITKTLKQLQGPTVIATLIFTSCQGICPMMVSDIKKLSGKLTPKEKDRVQYWLFSLDPLRDTPMALNTFAKKMKLDSHWRLFTSNENQIRELAAALGFSYKKLERGDFTHSTSIFLLSSDGEVKEKMDNETDRKRFEKTLKEILAK
jgi:protein SCO1/2